MNDRWQKAIDAVAACGIASRGQHDGLSIASPPGWVIVDASGTPARILAAFTIPSSEGDGGRSARLSSATALRSTPIRATWEGDVLNLEATVFEGSADTLTMYATDLVRTALAVAGVDTAPVSMTATTQTGAVDSAAEPTSWETPAADDMAAEPVVEPAGDPAAAWSAPAPEAVAEAVPAAWETPTPEPEPEPEAEPMPAPAEETPSWQAPAASSEPAAWQPPAATAAPETPAWQAPAVAEATPSWQAPSAPAEEAAVPPDPFAPSATTAPAPQPEPEPTPTYQSTMSYEAAALQGAIQPTPAAQPEYQQQAPPTYEEGTPVTDVVWVYVESQQPSWQNARPDAAQAAPVQPGRWYQLLRTLGDWSQVQGEGETPKWVDGRNLRKQ